MRHRIPLATYPEAAWATPGYAIKKHKPTSLFGLAPSGVYPATPVTRGAVRSYRAFSPLPACSPCLENKQEVAGGIFSVALSVDSHPPGVTWHSGPMEPGLSSIFGTNTS